MIAASSMRAASTSQMGAAHSGVNSLMCSINSSDPEVLSLMKESSVSPSLEMTCAMARRRATSEPTLIRRWRSAILARRVSLGSTTIILAPLDTAFLSLVAATGWHSVMLVPMANITSGCSISASGLLMAPLPMVAARPATVGACQLRLQLSI